MSIDIESMGENYYSVVVHRGDELVDGFLDYGSMEDVVYTMDCCIEDLDDHDTLSADISFEGVRLVHMPCLDYPDYDVVVDDDDFERLCIAVDINNFLYDYDPYEYRDCCESRAWGISRIYEKLHSDVQDLIDGLRGIYEDSGEEEAMCLILRVKKVA